MMLEKRLRIQNTTALVIGTNRGTGYAFVNALLPADAEKVYVTALANI